MTKTNITVLQVLPDLNSGGVERGTIELAIYLKQKGYNPLVSSNGGVLVKQLDNESIPHIKLPLHTKNPISMLINVYRLIKVIRQWKVDIIHARSRAPAWSCFFACFFSKCRFITTFHGAYSATHPLKRFYNSIMLRGEKVIAISNFIKKHIETRYRITSENIHVIDRGVNLEYFNPNNIDPKKIEQIKKELGLEIQEGEKIILLPARYSRFKGHIYMLKALNYIADKNYKCIFIGKAKKEHLDYVREIENFVLDLKLEKKVIVYKEAAKDMPALYAISDIVVCPSIEPEGFGRVIIEAQAMGKIAIATNIGAPREIIEDGKTGFLAPASDAATLAEVIQKALELSPQKADRMAKRAQATVKEKFSLTQMCQKTVNLYKSLLED